MSKICACAFLNQQQKTHCLLGRGKLVESIFIHLILNNVMFIFNEEVGGICV